LVEHCGKDLFEAGCFSSIGACKSQVGWAESERIWIWFGWFGVRIRKPVEALFE
jgi:hypothetical protein